MKKPLLILFGLFVSILAQAQTFTIEENGIAYTYQILSSGENECEVLFVQDVPEDADIVIPTSAFDGYKTYKVVGLGNTCFTETPVRSVQLHDGLRYLGWQTFLNCTHLTSITFPKDIKVIPSFQGCSSLESIELPKGITKIGSEGFSRCTSLKSIVLPDGVTKIEHNAFENCTALTTVDLPASLSSIEKEAFTGCSNIEHVKIHDLAAWCKIPLPNQGTYSGGYSPLCQSQKTCHLYLDDEEIVNLVIPDDVTQIPPYAFYNLSISSAVVPEGVTFIDWAAFTKCEQLTSVSLPSTLVKLGDSVFTGCTSLASLTLPTSLTNIGKECFRNCSSLTSLEIPEGITTLNDFVFAGCSSLRNLTLPHSLTPSSLSQLYFIGCSDLTLTLKSSSVALSSSASAIKKIILTEQVESIGTRAFSGAENLTEVVMEEGPSSIANNAFERCTALSGINLPESMESIGENAFQYCTALETVSMPGVKTIGSSAFQYCTALSSLLLPEGVTSIGSNAFYGCDHLTSCSIPYSCTSVGSFAFYGCTSLADVTINCPEVGSWFRDCPITKVTLGNKVTSLASSFAGMTQLQSVELPVSLRTMSGAFNGCTGLQSITIPLYVTQIGRSSFRDCVNLETVVMNSDNAEIGESAFENCSKLSSIVIPSVNTTIPVRAFAGCSNLQNVTIPSQVTTIKEQAFEGCSSFSSISMPRSTTEIGMQAFMNCTGITEIEFDSWTNVTLKQEAFSGCTGLTSVKFPPYYGGNVTIAGSQVFAGCTGLTTMTIPSNVFFQQWNSGGFLKNCTGLRELTIQSESAGSIAGLATGCANLEEVRFECSTAGGCVAGLPSIKRAYVASSTMDGTFDGCTGLVSVEWPEWPNLTQISNHAFRNCTSLKNFTAPSSLTSLEYYYEQFVFEGCTNLNYIDLRSCQNLFGPMFSVYDFAQQNIFTTQNTFLLLPESCFIEHDIPIEPIYDEWGNPMGPIDEGGETIYFLDYCIPNAIVSTWDGSRCYKLRIIDGLPVSVPEPFVTTDVEHTRTIVADEDAYTLCLPYSLPIPEGLKAYTLVSSSGDGTLMFSEITTATLEANQPYLVVASEAINLNVSTWEGVVVPVTPEQDVYIEKGGFRFCGTVVGMGNTEAATVGAYILQANNEWHPVKEENTNATIPAGRSYLLADQSFPVKAFSTELSDIQTGIANLQLIDRNNNSTFYDLSGHRIIAPRKGVNIMRNNNSTKKFVQK